MLVQVEGRDAAILDVELSEFLCQAVGAGGRHVKVGLVFQASPHGLAAAIFEHGVLVLVEEFLRTTATFEVGAAMDSVFATAGEGKVKARQVLTPLCCICT